MAKTRKAAAQAATPKPKPKAAAKPRGGTKAATKTASAPPSKAAGARAVRVRMYRQGLGDCFLLAFPRPDGGTFSILIDCGVILGTPDPATPMQAVVEDIVAATNNRVDVLVVTHEHWDHVSGFVQARGLFDKLQVGQVWMAWTEDPRDSTAQGLRRDRARRLAALRLGLDRLRTRLGAAGADPEAREAVDRAAGVLGFFGIDPATDPAPAGGLGAAAPGASPLAAAMDWARGKVKDPRFCKPGDLVELPEAGGVRAYVLGPPTDLKRLHKDLPTRSGRETYDAALALAAALSTFGATPGDGAGPGPDDGSLPFDRKYRIDPEVAATIDFFHDVYFGAGPDDPEAYRKIDDAWTGAAANFALQLDSDTNNTSLALAFELPDGRVLLFPGDAQVGNWESWHADSKGVKRTWKVGNREIDAASLLGRTVLYKVGHHGSHNATLRARGLELMPDGLTALVPVDVHVAHDIKHWDKMPFDPLMARLREKTRQGVVQADDAKAEVTARPGVRVEDSKATIQVDGPDHTKVTRPLYVDYVLDLDATGR